MKVKGSYSPEPFEYEIVGKEVYLHFFENVTTSNEVNEDNNPVIGWEFDRYTIKRPFDSGLIQRIEGNIVDWLETARQEEISNKATSVRSHRNKLLTDTDWTQLVDAPDDSNIRTAYRTYRQALRDIPQQPGFPYEVEYPELELSVA